MTVASTPENEKKESKKAAFQEPLILPEKFKEEDRVFLGNKEFRTEENERGVAGKIWDMTTSGSLKVKLGQLEAMIKQNTINEGALDQHLRHYIKKDLKSASTTLKCIAQMLINRSRDRGQSPGIQLALLFKAIDCLRMAIQYSKSSVNNIPSFLILQIIARMPKPFIPHMNREKVIFNHCIALQRAEKENLPNISIRNKLANIYLQQKCYADCLYQYEMILQFFAEKKPQTANDREKICVINLNIGDMYKDIYNFSGEFKNGQILQNFIFRYNRDAELTMQERTKINEIHGPVNKMTVTPVYKEMKQLAIDHYEKALTYFPKNKNHNKRLGLLTALGKSYAELGKAKEAAISLQDSLLLMSKEHNSDETFKAKDEILEILRTSINKIPAGAERESFKSFVIKEENSLEADKSDWAKGEKKKDHIRQGHA